MGHIHFRPFNWIELPFALFTLLVLLASIYLTFNSLLVGLFIPPIASIIVAGIIIRWINPHHKGFWFVYHTFALGGIFLIFLVLLLYKMFAPIFELIPSVSSSLTEKSIENEYSQICKEKVRNAIENGMPSTSTIEYLGYEIDDSQKKLICKCGIDCEIWVDL
ncbi:MAG: hypothetical protein Q8Q04_01765 [archaeon]|nr:hypothetical protein [archaeon]